MRKPIIGVLSHLNQTDEQIIHENYRKVINNFNGVPLVIMPTQNKLTKDSNNFIPKMSLENKKDLIRIIDMCNGLIFPGGCKIYEYDEFICKYALYKKIPFLGTCMGMQLMGIVDLKNSRLKKTILKKNESDVSHSVTKVKYAHSVNIEKNTRLYEIVKNDVIDVTSNHKYHLENTNKLIVSATSEDGYIEAVEFDKSVHPFAVGVQWHPEVMTDYDINARLLIESFIDSTLEKANTLKKA